METLHQANEIIAQRYRIVAPLGRGQSSSTYEAEDLTSNQRVALKVLSLRQITDWKVLELFEREAKILSNLNHPAIPKYINYFHSDQSHDRRFYLVQELVSGESLFKLVQKGWRPDEKKVQGIAIQVLEIINYLHEMRPPVIHRDIKPENLMRTSNGKIFLVDFGAVQDVYRNTLTRGGTFVGTLGYMPLEQFSGSVVPGSDLYSLGATLLFLLTGRDPTDFPEKRMKIDFRSRVQIKAQFADWLETMLAPAIEERFGSATEAQEALPGVRASTEISSEAGSVELKYPQPDNSEIFINKTDLHILVRIAYTNPPNLGQYFMLNEIGKMKQFFKSQNSSFALSKNAGILMIIIGIYTGSYICCLIASYLCYILMNATGNWVNIALKISKKTFSISSSIGGIVYSNHQGRTEDLEKVETQWSLNHESAPERRINKCVIWEGVRKYSLRTKSQEESDWLVAEISDFLDQLRSPQSVDR